MSADREGEVEGSPRKKRGRPVTDALAVMREDKQRRAERRAWREERRERLGYGQ